MYDIKPSPPSRQAITIGDKHRLKVECVGSIDKAFRGYTDKCVALTNLPYMPIV